VDKKAIITDHMKNVLLMASKKTELKYNISKIVLDLDDVAIVSNPDDVSKLIENL
jgi:hypothetical protein